MQETKNRSIGLKGLIVVGLTLTLLIPTLFIDSLIGERERRQEEAFKEISSKWAETQTLCGPIIRIF